MEYRIEQLARTAGVAVDTIRFYQGKGLLESPRREGRVTWYGETHLDRLRRVRRERDQTAVAEALQSLENGARDGKENLMPYIVDAVRAYATLGEMCNLLRTVYGEYREPALV